MVLRLLTHNAEHWLSRHLHAYLQDIRRIPRHHPRDHHPRPRQGSSPTPRTRSPSPSVSPTPPASPGPCGSSSTRSTTPRRPCPATPAPSPTSSTDRARHSTASASQLPEIWGWGWTEVITRRPDLPGRRPRAARDALGAGRRRRPGDAERGRPAPDHPELPALIDSSPRLRPVHHLAAVY